MNMPIEGARLTVYFKGIIDKFRDGIKTRYLARCMNGSDLNGKIVGKSGYIGR